MRIVGNLDGGSIILTAALYVDPVKCRYESDDRLLDGRWYKIPNEVFAAQMSGEYMA